MKKERLKIVDMVIADAEITKDTLVNAKYWRAGELLELLKIVDKSDRGYYVAVQNFSRGGIPGTLDTANLNIIHPSRMKVLENKYYGDATLINPSNVRILSQDRRSVGWKKGDRLELARVDSVLEEGKDFDFEVINVTQGYEKALVSGNSIKVRNQNRHKMLIRKYLME